MSEDVSDFYPSHKLAVHDYLSRQTAFLGGLLMTNGFNRPSSDQGWIEVISGCMFSGKTEELIRQIRRAHIAQQKTQIFKPVIDDRYSKSDVASHDQSHWPALPINRAREILRLLEPETLNVAIDEGQFFDDDLVEVATSLADQGKRVIIAGLDTDWRGRPFGPMPQLLALAEVIRKQYAICKICGAPATRTQRLISDSEAILVGSTESYEARCRTHFDPDLALRHLTHDRHALTLSEL